jgi:hypothetical protein
MHDNRSLTLDKKPSERSRGAALGPVRQRLSDLVRGAKPEDRPLDEQQAAGWPEGEQWPGDEELLPRFPLVRNGYDCAVVDAHIADLEGELTELDQELAQLRAQPAPRDDVADEIKRIGEQTSAVLIAANEQRAEILRGAREEADHWIADATAKATALTAESEARLRELRSEHEAAERERDRLLDDVRAVSAALAALADKRNLSVAAHQEAAGESGAPQSPEF